MCLIGSCGRIACTHANLHIEVWKNGCFFCFFFWMQWSLKKLLWIQCSPQLLVLKRRHRLQLETHQGFCLITSLGVLADFVSDLIMSTVGSEWCAPLQAKGKKEKKKGRWVFASSTGASCYFSCLPACGGWAWFFMYVSEGETLSESEMFISTSRKDREELETEKGRGENRCGLPRN